MRVCATRSAKIGSTRNDTSGAVQFRICGNCFGIVAAWLVLRCAVVSALVEPDAAVWTMELICDDDFITNDCSTNESTTNKREFREYSLSNEKKGSPRRHSCSLVSAPL